MLLKLLIKQLMRQKGLTWAELGELVDMETDYVRFFVNIQTTKSDMLKHLERILIALEAFNFDDKKIDKQIKNALKK